MRLQIVKKMINKEIKKKLIRAFLLRNNHKFTEIQFKSGKTINFFMELDIR